MPTFLKLSISYICSQPPSSNQRDERLALDDSRLVNENMLKTCDPNLNFHLTSLAKPEQRQAGLEAGADAYLVKSRFDQQELLNTIQSVL